MTYKESFGDRLEAFSFKYLNKFYIPGSLLVSQHITEKL